jgi:hypothetical protein
VLSLVLKLNDHHFVNPWVSPKTFNWSPNDDQGYIQDSTVNVVVVVKSKIPETGTIKDWSAV